MYNPYLCAITIPVNKQEISESEIMSFMQCLRVLNRHHIFLITHPDLDCSVYEQIALTEGVSLKKKCFDRSFFESIDGYNRLMLDKRFYIAFRDYSFLLIHQLDAYVFRDDLDEWCAKEYDYIGAPWFENLGSVSEGELKAVGNGGFSLRRVDYFIRHLTCRRWIFGFRNLPTDGGIITKIKFLLRGFNYIDSIIGRSYYNEDIFYCIFMNKSKFALRVPSTEEAARFAFEKSPSYLYSQIGNRLPMGCHAYEKNEYEEFWGSFINVYESD